MTDDVIDRGRAAKWLLEEDMFVKAVEAVKDDCVDKFLHAPDEESVRQARHDVHSLERVIEKLGAWATDGERATK